MASSENATEIESNNLIRIKCAIIIEFSNLVGAQLEKEDEKKKKKEEEEITSRVISTNVWIAGVGILPWQRQTLFPPLFFQPVRCACVDFADVVIVVSTLDTKCHKVLASLHVVMPSARIISRANRIPRRCNTHTHTHTRTYVRQTLVNISSRYSFFLFFFFFLPEFVCTPF